ncbi:MAG: hypothetical protein GX109_01170 [Bacteroidales bacterium]|nr:hypothetical protein [Bacteroidales bacterium]
MKSEKQFECCPPFDPTLWDDKLFEWNNKLFIKDSVRTFFFMPLNFGKVVRRLDKKLKANGADFSEAVCLSDHTSKWNMDIYVSLNKEINDPSLKRFNGSFYSKVYEGNFKDTGKWCSNYETYTKTKGFNIKKMYMWYTTCPKCAKKYGKNYTVILSEVEEKT